jgi:hypothetical protein
MYFFAKFPISYLPEFKQKFCINDVRSKIEKSEMCGIYAKEFRRSFVFPQSLQNLLKVQKQNIRMIYCDIQELNECKNDKMEATLSLL